MNSKQKKGTKKDEKNKNYNIINRAVKTNTGENLKTLIIKKKKKNA